jgi:cystathionine beta-synthase
VTDRNAAIYTRELVRREGIWAGNSAGSAVAGLLQLKDRFKAGEVVVVIFHDHGTRYLGKMFNPDWMRAMGYETVPGPTARDLVQHKSESDLVGVRVTDTVEDAIRRMTENDFSQVPITQEGRVVGSLSETHAYARMIQNPAVRQEPVGTIMQKAFRFIDIETPVTLLAPMITPENPALLVRDFPAGKTYILTGSDVLSAI